MAPFLSRVWRVHDGWARVRASQFVPSWSRILNTQSENPPFADLVRTGALRLALYPSFFYRKDPASGELRGFGIEILRALAERLRVPLKLSEYLSPPAAVAALNSDSCDVMLLGIEPARAAEVDFSPPLLQADFSFLVPQGSTVRAIADAGRPGTRIAIVRHHAMDIALRGQLPEAERVYADTPDQAFERLRAGEADVLAGIRPGLLMYRDEMPGAQVLDERYGRNVIGLAVKKGERGRLGAVTAFVTDAKASGLVQRALTSAGVRGVEVPT
jgi:polar amino acid transport system substrate-binding protein